MSSDQRLADYATYRRACGMSANTVRLHGNVLRRLGAAHDLDVVGTNELVAWLADHDWKPESRRVARSAVRGYFRWAMKIARVRPDDPAADLDPIRVPPPCPRPVPEDALAAALTAADDRTRLMILLASYAGLRCAELAGLSRENLEGDCLRITGKGGKVRVIPVSGELLTRLRACPPGWIFPSSDRPGRPISTEHAGRQIKALLPPGVHNPQAAAPLRQQDLPQHRRPAHPRPAARPHQPHHHPRLRPDRRRRPSPRRLCRTVTPPPPPAGQTCCQMPGDSTGARAHIGKDPAPGF